MNRHQDGWRGFLRDTIRQANAYYKQINVFISLVGVEIWNSSYTPMNITFYYPPNSTNADLRRTLFTYCKYHKDIISLHTPNDASVIFANYAKNSRKLSKGKASGFSTICSVGSRCAFINHVANNPNSTGFILVHELGHLLGLQHLVPNTSCSCKVDVADQHCIMGISGVCCNLETCQLHGRCTLCRERRHSQCDIEEYCSGESPICPEDIYRYDGTSCYNEDEAYCYNGFCRSHLSQCKVLWKGNVTNAPKYCYDRNERAQGSALFKLSCLCVHNNRAGFIHAGFILASFIRDSNALVYS
ncbi:disintegrin and metalloproteinase domain-containing protein 12-like [Watersipora subatra]|uniref:disintegrin and metalloproteinase domain-containing protein 12-like n=1 Tax=Watersipora subatra TaxID=2589382 RepID=UPI00355B0734